MIPTLAWVLAAGLAVATGPNGSVVAGASSSRPIITEFSPVVGAPGTSVLINGANFDGVKEVRFNTDAGLFTFVSPNQVIATVPLEATTGPISVTTLVGTAVTLAPFVVAPRISGFTPTNGPPGSAVIIDGVNFTGATALQFNGQAASAFTVTAQNQIHATVPTGASSGPIRVTTSAGTGSSTNNFVVTGTEPIIADFSPTNGAPGTIVTIEGRNFTGAEGVKFNGVMAASFFVTAPTQVSATVPVGASTGLISVTTPSGTGFSSKPFVVSTAPIITDFSPATGPPGTTVLIEGANFTGATAVKFNGANAASFFVPAPTQISAIVPTAATSGFISVTTPKDTGISSNPFFPTLSPVVTEFSPTNGPVGTIVTIDGVNFSGVTGVKFGGTAAGSFALVSSTQIRTTVPTGAATGSISVTTPKGTGSSTNQFVITTDQPVITEFSPRAGAPGASVLIQGINLAGATAVKFGGVSANFAVPAPTQITATIPPGGLSGFISVTTPFGTAVSISRFFVAPQITSISPTNGVPDTSVVIRGTNFADAIAVRFSGAAASFTNVSPYEIAAFVPTDATTGAISVTTPAGIVASTNVFTVAPEWVGAVRVSLQTAPNNQMTAFWPAAAWRYGLQSTERLSPPNWTPVTNRAEVVGERRQVTLGRSGSTRFLRLSKP